MRNKKYLAACCGVFYYLTSDHEKAIGTADELLEYKYRTKCLSPSVYKYIKNQCESVLNPDVKVDETFFNDYDCFRRISIWI